MGRLDEGRRKGAALCRPTQLIDLFARLGADGLLVEYEDMFPYSGELSLLQATAHPAYR